MKIEITEESGIKHEVEGVLRIFSFEDVVTVPDNIGEYFCSLGWANDVDGNVETGERDTSKVTLTPTAVTQEPEVQEA